MAVHLGDETIAAMLEGRLADDPARHARAHIAICDACRQIVSAAIEANVAPARAPNTTAALAPGAVIAGKYRVDRMLGEGGVGRVFVAHQLGLERPVAIKVLLPELARDAQALERFSREARAVASLTSEHVVRVHDLGALPTGEPYLVMELLDGEDLAQVIARGPVPIARAVGWIRDACEAIGEAHSLGILHRDLKPSNLFVTRRGQLKVLDFGLAKLATIPSTTAVGIVLGSPRYMAPEQITSAHAIDARADVWALGATLYHLITGRPPFPEESLHAIFASILSGRLPPFAGMPAPIAQVIERALARDPNARYTNVAELAAALANTAPAPASSRRWLIGVIWAMSIATVVTLLLVARHRDDSSAAAKPPATSGDPWQSAQPAPAATTPTPPRSGGNGPLGNMSSDRLRHRLEKLGWKIDEADHDVYSCDSMRFLASWPDNAQRWADITLFVCPDRSTAASEGARLRHGFPHSWVVDDDVLVLDVSTNTTVGSDEKQAKVLFDQLVAP